MTPARPEDFMTINGVSSDVVSYFPSIVWGFLGMVHVEEKPCKAAILAFHWTSNTSAMALMCLYGDRPAGNKPRRIAGLSSDSLVNV